MRKSLITKHKLTELRTMNHDNKTKITISD